VDHFIVKRGINDDVSRRRPKLNFQRVSQQISF